ncbi:MAG: hypothetical protein PHX78_06360 [bacterium]|nr:hypothetical protein [bacterium]
MELKRNQLSDKFLFLFFIIFTCSSIYAQEKIDENSLFSNPEMGIETTGVVDNKSSEGEKRSVGFSGQIISVVSYTGTKDWINKGDDRNNYFANFILGDFFIDVRLPKGTKGFVSVETNFIADTDTTSSSLKELFLDFNIKDKVYFRTGKQVLQWGRCYLWNPTDLINIEKKTFFQKIGSREGAYGIKMHIPFGTKLNIYSFIDTGKTSDADSTAVASKIEFLVGNTEMAFAVWGKKGYKPVYGYDFSTRIFKVDTYGEFAASHGENHDRMMVENGVLVKSRSADKWNPRASIGFNKSFDFRDVNDRITTTFEFYYNHTGYKEDIFNDDVIYPYQDPIVQFDSTGGITLKTSGTKKDFLLDNNLYEMNSLSRYYAALFTSYAKFIISDLTLNLNIIGNLDDKSSILTTGVTYTDINDFTLGFNIYSYLGYSNREYTFLNNALTAQVTAGIIF